MKNLVCILCLTGNTLFAQEKIVSQPVTKPISQNSVSIQPQPTVTVSATAPEITFTETIHDFASVKKGSSVVYKFPYKNTGKEPLLIYDCRAGCHCTTPKCSKEPLKPGKTGFIEVHYDSMRVGNFGKEIMVTSNAKNGIINLIIKGTIVGEEEGTDEKPPVTNEEKVKTPGKNDK